MDFENDMQENLSAASPQERLVLISNYFAAAKDKSSALAASKQAVRFITANSSLVNAPLREGEISTNLQNFRDAVDYWIQHAPDYGQPRQVDRRVNFSPEFLEEILNKGILTDMAFTATTKTPMDPDATYPFRNTSLHINARWAADVSHVSPDGHFQEHLLPSHARFQIVKGHIEKHDLEGDFPGAHPVKAHLWLEQVEPSLERQVPDPWTGLAQGASSSSRFPLRSRSSRAPAESSDQGGAELSPIESLQKTGAIGAKHASLADVSRFQANPVEFMQKNVVVIAAMPRIEPDENSPTLFCLYEWQTKTSTIGKVYRLSPSQDNIQPENQKIRAYLCDYRQDACHSIRVGREADLLLTPTLSGCSIGLRPEPDGSLSYCHANARTSPNQVEKQSADILAHLGQEAAAIHPNDYQNGRGDMATVVGVRNNDGWNLHFSSFEAGTNYRHSGATRTVQLPTPEIGRDRNLDARSERDRGRSGSYER
ncbi:hypothetical protein ACCS93_38865 [Rhizobium ruizarguesonis]